MIVTVTPNPVLDRTLTVSEIVLNEMTRALETREDWGGKGFNVSRALKALGSHSLAMGFAGGATGEKLAAGLHGLGIATDLIPVAGETRTNIVISNRAGTQYVKVNEPGPTTSPAEAAAFFDRVTLQARPGDLWALCGSLPPGLPTDFYAQLIGVLHERGAKVLLDTSGEPLRLGIGAQPYAVKPNLPEVAAWLGHPVEGAAALAEAVDSLMTQGITLVALSLGSEGLILATDDTRVWMRPPEVAALNPVGAGDALVAGLLWALSQALPLAEVAAWGVAAGTAAAMREGVSVGTRAEVQAIRQRVTRVPWPSG
ncbi:MAG: 1-phosphofructokinase [Anaerolineae bacterium]|nr:1-phosphofructokinase [Anaerolineae bacterium]